MDVTVAARRIRELRDDTLLLRDWIKCTLRDNDTDVDEIGDHVLRNAMESLEGAMHDLSRAANQLEAE